MNWSQAKCLGATDFMHPERGASLQRHVPRDLREAEQLTRVVPQRADHHVGPEAGPVLADAPALLLVPAVAGRGPELELGVARLLRVGGVSIGDRIVRYGPLGKDNLPWILLDRALIYTRHDARTSCVTSERGRA